MEPSDSDRSESPRDYEQFDDVLEEIFLLDDIWTTTWEELNASKDGMVLVDTKQYAAFLKWQAENQEEESSSAPLDRQGKSLDVSEKKDTTNADRLEGSANKMQSTEHDVRDQPSTRYGDALSDDQAQVWCEEFERKMDRMGIRKEFRQMLKLLEMSQLMDNDIRLFEMVKNKDDEKRQESSNKNKN
ncbi:uncharacterized protein FFB14_07415 [Fusarium fujikuroi]|nr:uncharacterized protein FFB14_07415 [Fusarium fujikuroi]